MKSYSVEVRTTYEIEALTREDALRAVPMIDDYRKPVSVEYVVRESAPKAMPERPEGIDSHGLDKPAYSVAEAARILGISASQMYVQANSGSIQSIRLGKRQIRIPRSTLIAVLEGTNQPVIQEPVRSPKRTLPPPPPSSKRRAQKTEEPRRPFKARPSARRETLTIPEAAGMLHVSAQRVRELVKQKKIFFTQNGNKTMIPKRAIEAYVEGKKPIDVVEANISFWKNQGGWDDDMEQAARALRKEWK